MELAAQRNMHSPQMCKALHQHWLLLLPGHPYGSSQSTLVHLQQLQSTPVLAVSGHDDPLLTSLARCCLAGLLLCLEVALVILASLCKAQLWVGCVHINGVLDGGLQARVQLLAVRPAEYEACIAGVSLAQCLAC